MMKFTRCGFLISENVIKESKRALISGRTLGMDRFEYGRQTYKSKKDSSHFMYIISNSPAESLLYTTKNWTFMMTNMNEDLELLKHALNRILEKSSDFRTEEIVGFRKSLGPSVMRMFHYLDQPEKALKFYYEFNDNIVFDSKTTLMILMDLLFLHGKYQEIIDVYNAYTVEHEREPNYIHKILVIAACYKLNTPKSLQIVQDLRNGPNIDPELEINYNKYFAAALALNQKNPKLALSILADCGHFTASMNIKLLAMAEMNDWHSVADLLCFIKNERRQSENGKRYRVTTEVHQKLKESLSGKDLSTKGYDRCNKILLDFQNSSDLLQKSSLDDILCWPIDFKKKIDKHQQIKMLNK